MEQSSEKKPTFQHVHDYLDLVEYVLGITDSERELLKSLLFGHMHGKLIITQYGTNVECVDINVSMNERTIAFTILEAFDSLSKKADPNNMAGGLAISFEESTLH